jgi:hypothetical protein
MRPLKYHISSSVNCEDNYSKAREQVNLSAYYIRHLNLAEQFAEYAIDSAESELTTLSDKDYISIYRHETQVSFFQVGATAFGTRDNETLRDVFVINGGDRITMRVFKDQDLVCMYIQSKRVFDILAVKSHPMWSRVDRRIAKIVDHL